MTDNLVIARGTAANSFALPFDAEVRGTAAAETVLVRAGADVAFGAGSGDGVRLPGNASAYTATAGGNTLTLTNGATEVTVALNAPTEIGFADGVVTAQVAERDDAPPAVTLGGDAVGDGLSGAALTPRNDSQPGAGVGGSGAANLVIADGSEQTMTVPFTADVRGTAAAETVQVPAGGDVRFGAGSGDRVAFAQEIGAYDFEAGGNVLTVHRDDGTTTGRLTFGSDGPAIEVGGGQAVDEGLDPAAVNLDGSDVSGIAETNGGGGGADEPVNAPELEVRFENPEAFGDTTDDFREATQTAWNAWMQHMNPHPDAGPVIVEMDFSADSALVAESSSTGTALTNEFIDGERLALDTVLADVADGFKENAAGEVDAEIGIRTNPQEWDFGPGTEAGNIDAESVLKHEFGRVFGMGKPFNDGFTGRFHANLEPFEEFNPDVGDPIPMNPTNPNTLADGLGVMSDLVNRDTVSEEITQADLRVMDTIGMPVKDSSLGIDDGAVA